MTAEGSRRLAGYVCVRSLRRSQTLDYAFRADVKRGSLSVALLQSSVSIRHIAPPNSGEQARKQGTGACSPVCTERNRKSAVDVFAGFECILTSLTSRTLVATSRHRSQLPDNDTFPPHLTYAPPLLSKKTAVCRVVLRVAAGPCRGLNPRRPLQDFHAVHVGCLAD